MRRILAWKACKFLCMTHLTACRWRSKPSQAPWHHVSRRADARVERRQQAVPALPSQ